MLLLLLACSETSLNEVKDDPGRGDGVAAGPDITVTPASVDFGVGAPGVPLTATLEIGNVGDDALLLGGLALAGDGAVSWTALETTTLPAGEVTATVLTWTPGTSGLADTLLVRSSDADEPEVAVPLTGSVPSGDIEITPSTHDFGTLDVGESDSVVLTVRNVGDGALTVSDWDFGATDGDLRVLDAGALSALPARFEPGASAEVLVEYAPSGSGGDEGSITVWSDDPDEPTTGAQVYGSGADDPCEGLTQTVRLMLTADDAWRGWMDGVEFVGPNQNNWSAADEFTWEMACGDHALALYATDTALAVSGVIAVVWVEDTVRFVSGPSNWTMLDVAPSGAWTSPSYDDSSWHIPQVCADTSLWGSYPQPFYDQGARWIWWTSDCRDLGEAWFRLNFTVP